MTEGNALTAADLRQLAAPNSGIATVLFAQCCSPMARNTLPTGEGPYWLLDEIALAQHGAQQVAAEPFQFWTLRVKPDRTATLTCEDGNGRAVFSKIIAMRHLM